MFKYIFIRVGHLVVNILPLKISYGLAYFVCSCKYTFSIKDRRAVENNLRNILGDRDDISQLSKEVFVNFGFYLVEFFRFKRMGCDEFIAQHVKIEGLEHIESALREGRGGICLSAHLGNWEYAALLFSKLGFPVTLIALEHDQKGVNDFFNSQRNLFGNTTVAMNQAVRVCTQALKENKLIGIVADRTFGAHGIEMKFLGKKSLLPKGAALFSLKHKTPILPIFLLRDAKNSFRLIIKSAINSVYDETLDEDEQIQSIMKSYIHVIEDMIRAHPSQWLMFREYAL